MQDEMWHLAMGIVWVVEFIDRGPDIDFVALLRFLQLGGCWYLRNTYVRGRDSRLP